MTALSVAEHTVPWERQPGETNAPWFAFERFRDLGRGRSLEELVNHPDTNQTLNTLYVYSGKNSWASRVSAFDDYIRRIEQEEYYRETRLMARKHAQQASDTAEALMAPVIALQKRLDQNPEAVMAELDDQTVGKLIAQVQASARVLQPIMNAERLAQGLPTEITEGREDHVISIDGASVDTISGILQSLEETNLLAHFLGEGATGEVVDAEIVEVDPGGPPPEADGFSARTAS